MYNYIKNCSIDCRKLINKLRCSIQQSSSLLLTFFDLNKKERKNNNLLIKFAERCFLPKIITYRKKMQNRNNYWLKRTRSRLPFKKRLFGEKIDISKFIQKSSSNVKEHGIKIENTFSDFNFCEPIKRNINKRSFITPTPIQDQALNHAILGRDIIGLADTGTGKTAVFLLPLIEKVYKDRSQKVLIITPTRELAEQIETEFRQFSLDMKIFSGICVGGSNLYNQVSNIRRNNPNFIIGTPGRLLDLSKRGIIKFNLFQNIVLDEVDRMLDMGFINDIRIILKQLPSERQSFFFSATMPIKIKELINQFSNNPVTIETKTGQTPKNVEQDIIKVPNGMKFNRLRELLLQSEVSKVLIFIETKREVERIARELINEGFKADSIHGDKRQNQRQKALKMFRDNLINILVATDVAARGLDINGITHVINYTVPQTFNDYIHRIGRTGRCNNKGFAYTFVENHE